MSYWTLEYRPDGPSVAGTEKTFEEWGFGQLTKSILTQGEDTATFNHVVDELMTPIFAPRSTIVIRKNRVKNQSGEWTGGTQWFFGIVTGQPGSGNAASVTRSYQISGPWWYLENKLYEQIWNIWSGTKGVSAPPQGDEGTDWITSTNGDYYVLKRTTHLALNQETTTDVSMYNKISTGQQMRDAIDWARKFGAPIQVGDEFPKYDTSNPSNSSTLEQALSEKKGCPNVDIMISGEQDLVCAEVIRKMLQWSPEAVTWFDYSTSTPTIHCKKKSQTYFDFSVTPPSFVTTEDTMMERVTIDTTNETIESLSVQPRIDILVPSVKINFEYEDILNTNVQSRKWLKVITQAAPLSTSGDEFAAMVATINMLGLVTNRQYVTFETTPIFLDTANFWRRVKPELRDCVITSITNWEQYVEKGDEKVEANTNLGYALTRGQIPPWLNAKTQEQTCKANIAYGKQSGSDVGGSTVTANIIALDKAGGTYTNTSLSRRPEQIPYGLAQQLYSSLKDLQYSGKLVIVENECSGQFTVGKLLNITGGDPAWATMDAVITAVTEDIDNGRTEITFGPAPHLAAYNLIELMRITRSRKLASYAWMKNGESLDADGVELGLDTPTSRAGIIEQYTPIQVLSSPPSTPGPTGASARDGTISKAGVITHNAKLCKSTWGSKDATNAIEIALSDAMGKSIKFREYKVCVTDSSGNDNVMTALFLASEPY